MARQIARLAVSTFLLARLLSGASALADDKGPEIDADFSTHSYDRWLFRAHSAMRGPAFGRWDLKGTGLRAILPAGNTERAPLKFVALLDLQGDFEATTQFELTKLPRPKGAKGSNRIELAVRGKDGVASVYRHSSRDTEGF